MESPVRDSSEHKFGLPPKQPALNFWKDRRGQEICRAANEAGKAKAASRGLLTVQLAK